MKHIEDRLKERNVQIPTKCILCIAKSSEIDTAFLLRKLPKHVGSREKDHYQRKESNGDMVILIVRGNYPCTIMYRRSNQNNTCSGLRVDKYLTFINFVKEAKYV